MYVIYYILLFITYFGILIDCQGIAGSVVGVGFVPITHTGGSDSSCTTNQCQRNIIVDVCIIVFLFGLILLLLGVICCWECRQGRPSQKNLAFINIKNSKQLTQEVYDIKMFPSGIWSSRYFQYKKWHGPHQFTLLFDPQSMKVAGSGSDDIGTFTIDGTYSIVTRRIGLTKTYQIDTSNPSENSGHQVIIQLEWNVKTNQFEGKWYIHTSKYIGEDKFELKSYGQEQLFIYQNV